jgi:acetoin utilization protein AcuC
LVREAQSLDGDEMAIGILCLEELKEYDFGPGHPFRGDRYVRFPRFLRGNLPENHNYKIIAADAATNDDLLLICDKEYIEFTREYYKAANLGLTYPGQFSQFHSLDNLPVGRPGKVEQAARLVVGQAKKACDLVQGNSYEKVVSVGGGLHHAKQSYGEGFCLYNDVAFCGLYLVQQYKLERILILDTDAHAGNGTCEYFYSDPRVLFIDIHQDPKTIYPGTGFIHQIGSEQGKGYTVNIPMPVNAGYDSYRLVFESVVEPMTREFKPQIIVRNGGSDPYLDDGLTSLGLPLKGFRLIGEEVRKMSEVCDGKVVDLIASGYNEQILPYAWLALIAGLANFKIEIEEVDPIPQRFIGDLGLTETEKIVHEVKDYLKDYWDCLR